MAYMTLFRSQSAVLESVSRLKSDQFTQFSLCLIQNRDYAGKGQGFIARSAICRKVAQFLLRALFDEQQVVSSMFIRRGIDALVRLDFSTMPKQLLCGSVGHRQRQRLGLERPQGVEQHAKPWGHLVFGGGKLFLKNVQYGS